MVSFLDSESEAREKKPSRSAIRRRVSDVTEGRSQTAIATMSPVNPPLRKKVSHSNHEIVNRKQNSAALWWPKSRMSEVQLKGNLIGFRKVTAR